MTEEINPQEEFAKHEEVVKNIVAYNVAIALATYQKAILQWYGDDFLIRAPDNLLRYFEATMLAGQKAKKFLREEGAKQRGEEVPIENKIITPSGSLS